MYNLILADLFKLRKSMAIKILFMIATVSAVLVGVVAYLVPRGTIPASSTGSWFLFSDVNMISLLGAVIAGVYICGDFENKTIHDAIANGCSRGEVIVSKAVAFSFAIAFLLLPYEIVTGIGLCTGSKFSMGSIAVGFLNLLTTGAGTTISAAVLGRSLVIMLTLIIVYVAQLTVCVPLAIFLKKPVFVVAIYYALTILSAGLASLRGSSTLFDIIFGCTPFGGNYSLVNLSTETGGIFKAIFVSLIFIIVILAITYLGFRKSEVK